MSPAEARARTLAGMRMAGGSATVPITNGDMAAGALNFAPLGGEAPNVGVSSSAPASSGTAAQQHNTALHLGAFLLAMGLFIALWDGSGFRMAYDVSLGR
jgi:hypothetical protein